MQFLNRLGLVLIACSIAAQGPLAQTTSSSSSSLKKPAATKETPALDAGSVSNNIYRNPTLALTCKIPAGWVLRTDELNAKNEDETTSQSAKTHDPSRVLLAAFSRPPAARGEDINSSILIAAETAVTYPGLKDAAQYLAPLTEVAKAQGFTAVDDPYGYEVSGKTLPRADFQKDVGTRVMRQSTLVMLAHAYAISFTFIGGTEDEVEELIDGLSFALPAKSSK